MKPCRRCCVAAICVAARPALCVTVVLRNFSGRVPVACVQLRSGLATRYIDVPRRCPRAE
jgi:hypothetical protein